MVVYLGGSQVGQTRPGSSARRNVSHASSSRRRSARLSGGGQRRPRARVTTTARGHDAGDGFWATLRHVTRAGNTFDQRDNVTLRDLSVELHGDAARMVIPKHAVVALEQRIT